MRRIMSITLAHAAESVRRQDRGSPQPDCRELQQLGESARERSRPLMQNPYHS